MQFSGLVTGFSSTAPEIALLDISYLSGTTTYSWSQTTTKGSPNTVEVADGRGQRQYHAARQLRRRPVRAVRRRRRHPRHRSAISAGPPLAPATV
jgi:hypothetical protein